MINTGNHVRNRFQELCVVTIYDIAKKLGISTSTVSRALREEKCVHKDTIALVKATADSMNYMYNAKAGMLRKQGSNQIGVLVPDISNPVYGLFMKGIYDALRPSGYHITFSNTYRDGDEEAALAEMYYQNRCAGLIFIGQEGKPNKKVAKILTHFNNDGRPLVFSGYVTLVDIVADRVEVDSGKGASMMTDYLIRMGHSKIAFLGGKKDGAAFKERTRGYREFIESKGYQFDAGLVIEAEYDYEAGIKSAPMIKELLVAGRITAAFCINDIVAIGLINALMDKGIRIPEDISVAGFDDIQEAQRGAVPLTTINQKHYDIGQLCASTIVNRLASKSLPVSRVFIDPELVTRSSVGKVLK